MGTEETTTEAEESRAFAAEVVLSAFEMVEAAMVEAVVLSMVMST